MKWYVYSAHDTTMGALFAGFKLTSVDCILRDGVRADGNKDTCIIEFPYYATLMAIELR